MFVATFALLAVIELQNVLDFRSYLLPDQDASSVWHGISEMSMTLCDVNAIPHEERLECIYTRGLATELATWIFSRFDLVPEGRSSYRRARNPWTDFYWPFLAHFTVAIEVYKKRYSDHVSSLTRGCTRTLVQIQINRCVSDRPELVQARRAIVRENVQSIVPPFPFSSVIKIEQPLPFSRGSSTLSV
jgi:hypothetical protein